MTPYTHDPHWVSRTIRSDHPLVPASPLLSAVLLFGTVPNVTFLLYVAFNGHRVSRWFLVAQAFTVLWLNVGPYLIWYYDQRIMPTFSRKLGRLLDDEERAVALGDHYDTMFSDWWWLCSVPLSGLMLAAFVRTQGSLAAAGVFDIGGPFYWLLLALVAWTGFVGGVGFSGVAVTLLYIRDVANEDLTIDPLHPDQLGGLSIVGYYAIRTTLMFSTGSLFLPLALQIALISEYTTLMYTIIVVYSVFIALSFVYPTYRIHLRARQLRDGILDDLRREYAAAKETVPGPGDRHEETSREELLLELQARRIRQEYEDYETVRLYPLQVDILVQLVGSIILPFLFLVLEMYAQQFLVNYLP